MVKLLIGHKGSGKTNTMVQLANESIEKSNGSIVFINKNHRLMYELNFKIRVICMEDFEHITNIDEYIGFLYGIFRSRYRDDIHRQHIEACGCILGRSSRIHRKAQEHFGNLQYRLYSKRKCRKRRNDRSRFQ